MPVLNSAVSLMDEGFSRTGRRVLGYALRWNEPAHIAKGSSTFVEIFRSGAFAKSIANKAVKLCLEHDTDSVIASQSNGTLCLVEDLVGLRIDATIADSIDGDEAMAAVRQRSKTGLSISFGSAVCEWQNFNGTRTRSITNCDLVEVSICRNPAYGSSEIVAGAMRINRFLSAIDLSAERNRRLFEAERRLVKYRYEIGSVHDAAIITGRGGSIF